MRKYSGIFPAAVAIFLMIVDAGVSSTGELRLLRSRMIHWRL